jgi:hypothetical protein
MFSIRSRANRATEHNWFAWRPVLAAKKTDNGLTYHWVWFKTVKRRYIRSMNMGQWSHELA